MTDLPARLRAACNGHPHARIPWPHHLLHEAADRIEALTNALAAIKADGYAVVREEAEAEGAVVTPVDGPGVWRIEPVDVPFVTVDGLRVGKGETLIIERRALPDENGDEVRG